MGGGVNTDDGFHVGGEDKIRTLFLETRDEADALGYVLEKRSVVVEASKERTQLLKVFGYGHVGEGSDFVSVRANAWRRDDAAKQVGFGVAQAGFGKGKHGVVLVEALKQRRGWWACGRWVRYRRQAHR